MPPSLLSEKEGMEIKGTEAYKYIWEGAIPLQIHLHESEVTTLPPPSAALILAPRIGYLPLLVPHVKPFFSGTLPPGVDTVWFEYKGLPLKWYIPTGVLFDLLCAEPERPWNLTVHFRGYPGNILIPCEGEDNVKWSFINSLKEAAYIINGNCKNVMNMSQSDQIELWRSVLNGNLEAYLRVSSKLKLGTAMDGFPVSLNLSNSRQHAVDTDDTRYTKPGRYPVRLYVQCLNVNFNSLEDIPTVDSWDKISYINRPVEINGEAASKYFSLCDAIKALLPEFFATRAMNGDISTTEIESEQKVPSENTSITRSTEKEGETLSDKAKSSCMTDNAEIILVRVQGIEPKLDIPFTWVVNNLMNPEYFLHLCVYLKVPQSMTT